MKKPSLKTQNLIITCFQFEFQKFVTSNITGIIKELVSEMEYLQDENDFERPICSLLISNRNNQRVVGAAVRRRGYRKDLEDRNCWIIELFDFIDNEQFSNLDSFFIQIGVCKVLIPEEGNDKSCPYYKKLHHVVDNRNLELVFVKKTLYKKSENIDIVSRLVGDQTYMTNSVEV
jgi:hypothetical protein